jgi:shikimate dehydrogenase
MPLKRVVRSHLARVSDLATAVGAVNTVIFTDDGPFGENTDVYGIVAALAEVGLSSLKGAAPPVILGGGATAASALGAVREMGAVEVCVLVRSPDRAKDLPATAGRLGLELTVRRFEAKYVAHAGGALSEDVPLIVSTLPAGAGGDHVSALSERFSGAVWPVLLDVAYDPWPSDLAAAWAERGATSANGFSMLLHQAAEQVRLMTGFTAPIETMRAAGAAELARRHGNGA